MLLDMIILIFTTILCKGKTVVAVAHLVENGTLNAKGF